MIRECVERLLSSIPGDLLAAASEAAEAARRASNVLVATHIDADGISAAAVASAVVERMGAQHRTMFFKKLDDKALTTVGEVDCDIIWFTDLGSGAISKISGLNAIVTDHHVPDANPSGAPGVQSRLSDFATLAHVNPNLHGISGANELSGAGAAFLVAIAANEANADLSPLALLGGVGDLQDQRTRRLEGLNRLILDIALDLGLVEAYEDIRYFGRETRPVFKMLEYSSDPYLPRITGQQQEAISFLLGLGVELKDGDSWRTWAMLSEDERRRTIDALRSHLGSFRRKEATIARLTGEVYTLLREEPGSPVRDMKEYATLLNACGRHGRAEVGMRICAGDRGAALSEGFSLLRDHRSALSRALEIAKTRGITRMKHIQYFDAEDDIEETIIGTVAGMLLGSNGMDRTAPMVAFAESLEPSDVSMMKVSSRGTQDLVAKGLDLSTAIRRAAEEVGGVGGGHNIAAGATIPSRKQEEFLRLLDEAVGQQLYR